MHTITDTINGLHKEIDRLTAELADKDDGLHEMGIKLNTKTAECERLREALVSIKNEHLPFGWRGTLYGAALSIARQALAASKGEK